MARLINENRKFVFIGNWESLIRVKDININAKSIRSTDWIFFFPPFFFRVDPRKEYPTVSEALHFVEESENSIQPLINGQILEKVAFIFIAFHNSKF